VWVDYVFENFNHVEITRNHEHIYQRTENPNDQPVRELTSHLLFGSQFSCRVQEMAGSMTSPRLPLTGGAGLNAEVRLILTEVISPKKPLLRQYLHANSLKHFASDFYRMT
jgi:hypothetical protein